MAVALHIGCCLALEPAIRGNMLIKLASFTASATFSTLAEQQMGIVPQPSQGNMAALIQPEIWLL